MKTRTFLLASLLAATLAAAVPASAATDAPKAATTQQQRMKGCNAEAKARSLKGDERKSFMSACLKGAPAVAAGPAAERPAPRR